METIRGRANEYVHILVALDETHLAAGYYSFADILGKKIPIINWKTGATFGKLIGHSKDVLALANLDAGWLASGSRDTTIKIWQWMKGRLEKNLTGHVGLIEDLLSITNFTRIVSCSEDMTIKVWNRSSGTITQTFKAHSNKITLLFNGYLASATIYATICIWNLTRRQSPIRNLTGHSARINSLVNLDPSRRIASGANDRKIKIWSVDRGEEMKTLSGHNGEINSLVFLPNGNLVSASMDKTIRIWDLDKETHSLIKTKFAHSNVVFSLALLEDGNLASGSHDFTIKIWHFESNSTNYSGKGSVKFEILFSIQKF
jgi:WD40 repeat protein